MKYFMRHKPYSYQDKALSRALERDSGYAFLFDPGLGKTKPAIDFAGINHLKNRLYKVLIAGPLASIGVWEEEIEEHLPSYIPRQIIRLDSANKKKAIESIPNNPKILTFVIGTYETITKYLPFFLRWTKGGLAIADESHLIKNPNSARSRAFHKLRNTARWRLICTGTPTAKNYLGIFSQYKFIDDSIFGPYFGKFKDEYVIYGGYMGYEIKGYKNLKRLSQKIRSAGTRVKKDKAKGLPEKIFSTVPVVLSKKEQSVYQKMAKESVIEFENGDIASADLAITRILRLQQIAGGFVKKDNGEIVDVGSSKLQTLLSLLDSYKESREKVVIYCRFKREIKKIAKHLKKENVLILKGGMSGKKRQAIRRKFQNDEGFNYPFIIVQIGAAISISLDKARTAIYYSLDFNTENFIQSQDRIHRSNTEWNSVHYIFLLARGTVDEGIYKLLQANIDLSTLLLDDYKKLINGTLKVRGVRIA